jgi:hypothetical protein
MTCQPLWKRSSGASTAEPGLRMSRSGQTPDTLGNMGEPKAGS